ncbi:hypothetical protein [Rhodobacter maris]|uniref:Uncharacterized protein n=1 Tax=Rhodobacter maris TaxID=446682 RepID=A0A285S5H3_9RHOB|nr:hypothetical protein [Rhodobacter maris]SOC02561.1 hypothetical protein SAMN05877831_103187 [Rhodobacter maris]
MRGRATPPGPVLDLSGDRLRRAMADLAASAEPTGGVNRYLTALHLKSALFKEVLGQGATGLSETEFLDLVAFMAPVRRRIGPVIARLGVEELGRRIEALLHGEGGVDARLARFIAAFPNGKEMRWVRDLGAELLHFTQPSVPLMARWVWDARVSTGVLREIWHAADVDMAEISVPDDLATFTTLYAELEGFLEGEGVWRDRIWMVDLLMAHIYAGYINDRGGQYLRSDFTQDVDPMLHTRRMLGLDAVDTETGRTRLRLIDGSAHEFGGGRAARLDVTTAEATPEDANADP